MAITRGHAGILVVDTDRRIFEALRSLPLHVPLWCVEESSRITRVDDMDLAIHAACGPIAWRDVLGLAARVRTMIVADTTSHSDALHALSCGLIGYTDLSVGSERLRAMVEGAMRGEAAYAPDVLGKWLDMQRGRRVDGEARTLTPRQLEVLALVARGEADKEIAAILGISTATAQRHVTNILDRLRVRNRAAAVAAAFSPAATWLGLERESDEETLVGI